MLYSAEDLATQEFPDETYLVEGLIPLGGLALLHGKRGIGKSTCWLQGLDLEA